MVGIDVQVYITLGPISMGVCDMKNIPLFSCTCGKMFHTEGPLDSPIYSFHLILYLIIFLCNIIEDISRVLSVSVLQVEYWGIVVSIGGIDIKGRAIR